MQFELYLVPALMLLELVPNKFIFYFHQFFGLHKNNNTCYWKNSIHVLLKKTVKMCNDFTTATAKYVMYDKRQK